MMLITTLAPQPNTLRMSRHPHWSLLVGACLALLLATPAFATRFTNQFIEFELPPQWQCQLEGAEWVCQSTHNANKKEAIVVLAAKLQGEKDSLDQYLVHLKAPKNFLSTTGRPVQSTPKYANSVNLNGQPWIDSLHLDSEVPGFFTRYLATVKQGIGVLVTYSVNKSKYQNYINDFNNMIATLKVFHKNGGINVAPPSADLFKSSQIPSSIGSETIFPGPIVSGAVATNSKEPETSSLKGILLIAAVLGLLLWVRNRNRND